MTAHAVSVSTMWAVIDRPYSWIICLGIETCQVRSLCRIAVDTGKCKIIKSQRCLVYKTIKELESLLRKELAGLGGTRTHVIA